jgi:hypothetical protein
MQVNQILRWRIILDRRCVVKSSICFSLQKFDILFQKAFVRFPPLSNPLVHLKLKNFITTFGKILNLYWLRKQVVFFGFDELVFFANMVDNDGLGYRLRFGRQMLDIKFQAHLFKRSRRMESFSMHPCQEFFVAEWDAVVA